MSPSSSWIWRCADWPNFTFDAQMIAPDLAEAYRKVGVVEGKAVAIGLESTGQIALDALFDEALATAAIEGERLSLDIVRPSVMRRLGLATSQPTDRYVDGLVEILIDASTAFDLRLDEDRLCRWHSALFPGGASGIRRIAVGRYRDHDDPMQIVSGVPGREVVHYEAPPSKEVPEQMKRFLAWFAESSPREGSKVASAGDLLDGFARVAIAHLWFECIHPFEDGNGRIGRAVVDMAMAQHLRQPVRLYSVSRQLLNSRSGYYDALNHAQRGGADLTVWVKWFVRQCSAAFNAANEAIDRAVVKRNFEDKHKDSGLHERQRKVLKRLLDDGDGGFLDGLNAEKYMKMTGVSKATATRDLSEMVTGGQLWCQGMGKALRYYINVPEWSHGMVPRLGPPSLPEDAERDVKQSELNVRAALIAAGYTLSEPTGEQNRQYFGPIVALSMLHVGQDIGRRQAVIHEIRLLDRVPVMGAWLDVRFKDGQGTVTNVDEASIR